MKSKSKIDTTLIKEETGIDTDKFYKAYNSIDDISISEMEKITEWKHDEDLKEWTDTFDAFVIKFDINGFIVFCNAALLRLSGLSEKDLYGKYFPDTGLWSHSKSEREKIIRTLNNAKAYLPSRTECTFKSAAGKPVPAIFNSQPVLDNDGNIKYITGEGKTIVEETELRARLIEANKNLESRVKERTAEISIINEKLRDEIAERLRAEHELLSSRNRFRDFSFSVADVLWEINPDGIFTYCSNKSQEVYGYNPDELIGKSFNTITPDEDQESTLLFFHKFVPKRKTFKDIEHWIQSRSGEKVCILTNAIPVFDDNGSFTGYRGVDIDITQKKLAEEENIRLAAISQESPNPIVSCDPEGNITYINPAAKNILNELGITKAEDFLPKDHRQLVLSCLKDRKSYNQIEAKILSHFFSWTYNPVPDIKIIHIHGMDITDQKYVEQRLLHDALHDSLTGLPNRVMFRDMLERSMKNARRTKDYNFAVLFLDLTRFKIINDSLGHLIGDKVLVKTAERLTSCLRPGDMAARFGGDEFTIFLNGIENSSDAVRVAKRIQKELSATMYIENQEINPSAGIGIALCSKEYSEPEDLLRDANTAMFKAKSHGVSNYVIFDKKMHLHALKLLQLETDLQHAIEREEFMVYYQPIISLGTGKLNGFEALLRWQRPGYGLMLPDDFISFIEETDMILTIGEWVLQNACGQLREWHKKFTDKNYLTVSVNLSARQFSQPDLINKIKECLQKNNLYASALKLEITESVIMENYNITSSMLMQLRQMNVHLSIDDFGTGYSSLSHLHKFPIHTLKIDRSFVNIIKKNGENSEIAQTIINLARNLGINVVAEGIETEEQMAILKKMDCEYGQGFFISTPLTSEAVTELLSKNHTW